MKKNILTNLLMSILIVISVLVTSVCVYAASDMSYSLTAEFVTESGPVSGSEFKVYRALSSDGELLGDFAGYAVDTEDLTDSEAIGAIGDTLAAYALRDKLPAEFSAVTNAAGSVSFGGLSEGIYLVTGTPVTVDNIMYIPKPALVRIPYTADDGSTVTDVVIEVKYDRRDLNDGAVERSVTKVWDDNDYTKRPSQVTIQLLKDGEIYETVTLNEQSGWQHKWTGLDARFDWQVTEGPEIPYTYNVRISLNETEFIVTNTIDRNVSSDDDVSTTTTTTLVTTSSITTTTTAATTTAIKEPSLPQTGQLWWPVPVMFIAGALLFIAGMIVRGLNYDEKT